MLKECRFCLLEGFINDKVDPLVQPCKCSGSIAYVHKQCLIKWRRTDVRPNQDTNCPLCKSVYDNRIVPFFKMEAIPSYNNNLMRFLLNPIYTLVAINYTYMMYFVAAPHNIHINHDCVVAPRAASASVFTGILNISDAFSNTITPSNKPEPCVRYFIVYDFTTPFVILHSLMALIYIGAYLNLVGRLNNKLRYLYFASKYAWIPLLNLWTLVNMKESVFLMGSLNLLVLPFYLNKHIELLRTLNAEF